MIIDPDKEEGRFISLREVLFIISEAKQCDPQKAAQWLLSNMHNAPDAEFKEHDFAYGLINTESGGTALEILKELARTGIYKKEKTNTTTWDDFDDIPF